MPHGFQQFRAGLFTIVLASLLHAHTPGAAALEAVAPSGIHATPDGQLAIVLDQMRSGNIAGIAEGQSALVETTSQAYQGTTQIETVRSLRVESISITAPEGSSYFLDTFSAPAEVTLADHAPSISASQSGWSVNQEGVWLLDGAAQVLKASAAPSGKAMALFDSTQSNGLFSFTVMVGSRSNRWVAGVFRWQDASNYWQVDVEVRGSRHRLRKISNGVSTLMDESTGIVTTGNHGSHRVRVALEGPSIQISLDGNPILSANDAAHAGGTTHGVMLFGDNWDRPHFKQIEFKQLLPGATILARLSEPIYAGDTAVKLTADAGFISDGTYTSWPISALVPDQRSEVPPPRALCRLVGVVKSSEELGVEYSVVEDAFEIEAVAFSSHPSGGSPVSAVVFEATDGANSTVPILVTAMTRSRYHPREFYTSAQAGGFLAADPFVSNGGGSGVFAAQMNVENLADGPITVTATAYPSLGNASSITSATWQLYKDGDSSLIETTFYLDTRGAVTVSAISGSTPEPGAILTGQSSGALLAFVSLEGNMLRLCSLHGNPTTGEVIATADGWSAQLVGTLQWNGNNANSGLEPSTAWRTGGKAVDALAGGADGHRYTVKILGEAGIPVYWGQQRGSSASKALSTWATFEPADGLTQTDVVLRYWSGAIRAKRIALRNQTIRMGGPPRGDGANYDARIWIDKTSFEGPGRQGASGATITFGDYSTRLQLADSNNALTANRLFRDCSAKRFNGDLIKATAGGVFMESYLEDNESPNPEEHEDGYQIVTRADHLNLIFYNLIFSEVATGQVHLADAADLVAHVNVLAVSAIEDATGFSQLGDPSKGERIRNVYFMHTAYVNGRLGLRSHPESVFENVIARYSVFESLGGDGLWHNYNHNHNHLLNATGSDLDTLTGALDDRPWANGIGSLEGDDPARRDFRPLATHPHVANRIPPGERYIPYDLFGNFVPNDGTGAIGPLQPAHAGTAHDPGPTGGALHPLPSYVGAGSLAVAYYGVVAGSTPLAEVRLWQRHEAGQWEPTEAYGSDPQGTLVLEGLTQEGRYSFAIRSTDVSGLSTPLPAALGMAQTMMDRTPPALGKLTAQEHFSAPPIVLTYDGVADTASGLAEVRLWARSGAADWAYTGLSSTFSSDSFSVPAPGASGSLAFALQAVDAVGNATSTPTGEGQATTILDSIAPIPGTLSGPSSATVGPIALSYAGASDLHSGLEQVALWVRKPGAGWTPAGMTSESASGAFTYSDLTLQGQYYFGLRASDRAGNFSTSPTGTGQLSLLFDSIPPTLNSVSSPVHANAAPIQIQFAGDATTQTALLWARRTGTPWADTGLTHTGNQGVFNYMGASQDGAYEFAVQLVDAFGNATPNPTEAGASTIFDTTPPVPGQLSAPANASQTPISILFSGVSDNNGSGVDEVALWFRKDGGPWTSSGLTATGAAGAFSFEASQGEGDYGFGLRARDRAGNHSAIPTGQGLAQTSLKTPFNLGALTAPQYATVSPILLAYSEVSAGGAAGTVTVRLWAKVGEEGTWTQTGLSSTGGAGSFEFSDLDEEGPYFFALQAESGLGTLTDVPTGHGQASTLYDTTPPSSTVASPAYARSLPVHIEYDAEDEDGSGVQEVRLWIKRGASGEWEDTEIVRTKAAGTIAYEGVEEDGIVYFAIQAFDHAGLSSPVPTDAMIADLLDAHE